ncbi:hypothetical protein GCM10010109_77040 [Actinoplanes campanulatus]|nr:hypothetical protein GCM10010109_77040 [Actinoplanes campanulatus]GID40932.1 hypothetical protein Aca09nite_74380 [Actinoplanes campanulatus]
MVAAFVAAHRWLPPASYRPVHLPAEVVSVSECLTDCHPHDQKSMSDPPWHRSLDDALDAAAGDAAGCVPEPAPEHIIKRVLKRITNRTVEEEVTLGTVHTLAMSVPASDADGLLTLMRQSIGDYPHPILTNLALGAPPPAGQALGFEVLGFDEGWFHTWLCYTLHEEAATRFGVFPNERGLLNTLAEARLVSDMANEGRGTVGGFAEEYTWFPALVTQHDLVRQAAGIPGSSHRSSLTGEPL